MTNELAPITASALMPKSMDDAFRLADFMAKARTVPRHLQGSPGDCLMVIEQAMRWGMSPFAVAQATSVISGKMMYEGKLVAAVVESSGAIVGQLDYEFTGKGETRVIVVSGTRRGETQPRTVTVALTEARTANDIWKRQPDQQLVYHGARVWARRWTPAVILGVYSKEEMGPIIEGEAEETPSVPVQASKPASSDRERINAEVPLAPPANATPHHRLDEAHGPTWLANLERLLTEAPTREEGVEIAGHPSVDKVLMSNAPQPIKDKINELLAAMYDRLPEAASEDDELPEIVGQDKVAAG